MAVAIGERRIVTVLFADIVGSTAIGETLGPERAKLLVDEVMRLMSAEVERFEGTVAQYVGDELYAVFGAPLAHEDDSERAVLAALGIQHALEGYAEEARAAYAIELAVRIAINTGPVVISPDSEDPYNALGETVNVAARIQELVEGGEIVVGQETRVQVRSCFEFESLGEHSLRGVSDPVTTYRVVRTLELEPAPARVDIPLAGRDYELSLLERVMDDLLEGRGSIVTIHGEPGIGKSRLVLEIRERHGDRIRFVEGRALSYARNLPYWPVRDLMRDWLSLSSEAPEARVRLELKTALARLFGDQADAAYPFLATLLGLTLEPEAAQRIRELNRESLQRETFEFVGELVCQLAAETSLCLVLDDLHWADDATLELLEELLATTEEAAVSLVFVARTELEHGSWALAQRARQRYPHRYREIELRPLPDDASRALAASVADAGLPESVADLLVSRSGGNPFFLEAALRSLIERGVLRREDGQLALAVPVHQLSVPTVVQGALQARLDRLAPATRDVLSTAAVVGRSFTAPLLELILPPETVMPALADLQRLDLIVEERRRPMRELRFRHGLVQEVAYASLVEAKRRKLHRRVGEALESLHADSPPFGVLARHFEEADVPEKAAEYLLRAGDEARKLYANQEAIAHYGRARVFLARLGDDERARETLFKIALAHHLAFDFEGAEAAYDEAFCCRVVAPTRAEPTETVETAIHPASAFTPGHAYSTPGVQLADHLFRGLLSVDGEMNVVPELADNFRVSSDGLTYLFRLRDVARWSDGQPVTAGDFVYGWDRLRTDSLPTAILLDDVAGATALDDRTLEVRVKEPRSYFPYILASSWAAPWPRHVCERLGEAWREPESLVCNGPFVLSEFTDEHALLEANPLWAGARGNVRHVRFAFRERLDDLIPAWESGGYDVLTLFQKRARDLAETTVTQVSGLTMGYVGFRADREPFSNLLVRKAFCHAVDRERAGPLFGDVTHAATRGGALPPAMPGHSHRIALEHDPERARSLLAEAGYPGGQGLPELELTVPAWAAQAKETGTGALTEQWEAIGARVHVRVATCPIWSGGLGEAQLWLSGWTADYPDPDGFFRGLFALPDEPFFRDEDVEDLLRRARAIRDQGERMRLYHELDRLWVNERAAILPLSYSRTLVLSRPWVHNLWMNPMQRAPFDRVIVDRPGADRPQS
jgi:ABC-type transport system substrate-binding protein/class 3 adenylate cyclase